MAAVPSDFIVSMLSPLTEAIRLMHNQTASPSHRTGHAPHATMPNPYLTPSYYSAHQQNPEQGCTSRHIQPNDGHLLA